jgi:hypothetical protein
LEMSKNKIIKETKVMALIQQVYNQLLIFVLNTIYEI